MKYLSILIIILIFSSCSTGPIQFDGGRVVASSDSCAETMKSFLSDDSTQAGLNIALSERKLISYTDKLITVNYPKIEWVNETKHGLINRIKNWNKNEYPIFYMDAQEKYTQLAESFPDLLEKEIAGTIDAQDKTTLNSIRSWIDTFKAYQTDLDNLLDERISYQFNLNMLKEIHLDKNEARDVKLTFKINGETKNEILTFRLEDRNKQFFIKQYADKIRELDGKLGQLGKIEERVVKQAILFDAVTILQRKLEYHVKNTDNILPELVQQLDELNTLLADKSIEPSTFGVYKVNNQVFKAELADLFKSKKVSADVNTPASNSVQKFINGFFGKNPVDAPAIVTPNNPEPIASNLASNLSEASGSAPVPSTGATPGNVADGVQNIQKAVVNNITGNAANPLKKIYAKLTSYTPFQKFKVTAELAVVGYGSYRYFYFNKSGSTTDVSGSNNSGSAAGTSPLPATGSSPVPTQGVVPHEVQAANTAKIEDAKSQGHSSVIELQIAKLKKQFN